MLDVSSYGGKKCLGGSTAGNGSFKVQMLGCVFPAVVVVLEQVEAQKCVSHVMSHIGMPVAVRSIVSLCALCVPKSVDSTRATSLPCLVVSNPEVFTFQYHAILACYM